MCCVLISCLVSVYLCTCRLEEIEGLINLYLIVYPKEQGHYKTLRGEELITVQ